jgi:uncharacterized protein YuzE
MMRTSYDPEADAFAVRFAPKGAPIANTEEVAPGVMLDFDADGKVIGVEVLSVSWRMAVSPRDNRRGQLEADAISGERRR